MKTDGLKQFSRVTILKNGAVFVMEPKEARTLLLDYEDDEYQAEDVKMTQADFESMREFEGF